ncbi:MAG: hypothetical protein J7L98_05210 [Candidatus Verstraetearchaeota archaeon]|nr:hypothetical protein [Candidatus Verstraetearchaeota archaeon]
MKLPHLKVIAPLLIYHELLLPDLQFSAGVRGLRPLHQLQQLGYLRYSSSKAWVTQAGLQACRGPLKGRWWLLLQPLPQHLEFLLQSGFARVSSEFLTAPFVYPLLNELQERAEKLAFTKHPELQRRWLEQRGQRPYLHLSIAQSRIQQAARLLLHSPLKAERHLRVAYLHLLEAHRALDPSLQPSSLHPDPQVALQQLHRLHRFLAAQLKRQLHKLPTAL